MKWNWERPDWPNFTYDLARVDETESQFLHGLSDLAEALSPLNDQVEGQIWIDLLSDEAFETSKIEGEMLNRDSLQASVGELLGLAGERRRISPAERGIAEVMVDVYRNFQGPLTVEKLELWHEMLMQGRSDLRERGCFRSMGDPMQIVSGPLHHPKVHFEAPPAATVRREMERFLDWFNTSRERLPALVRCALGHLYFESIHPFEDGNGRIGRAIVALSLSQSFGKPILLALSQTIGKHRNLYYDKLAVGNRSLEVTDWVCFFSEIVLKAQERAMRQVEFGIAKAEFFDPLQGRLNERQKKVLLRMFEAGVDGFVGGLSAGNYQRIAKTSPTITVRDLGELVELDAFYQIGEGRHTRYHLKLH